MWRIAGVWIVVAFLLSDQATAQQYAYSVTFKNKNNTPYSLSSPLSYLTSRSVTRRVTQGIAIDSTDLPVNQSYIDSVLTLTGGILHGKSRWLNLCVILLDDSANIHIIEGKPYVGSTKLVGIYSSFLHHKPATFTGTTSPFKTGKRATTTESDFYGATYEQTFMVSGAYLHSNGFSGNGKLIAVMDAGFTGTDTHTGFDSLRNDNRIADVHNFTYATDFVYSYDAHGTEVLSTMAGNVGNSSPNNFVGSAPKATYALYVTEDNGSEQPTELYNMLFASERADSIGADVITTSLGYNTFTYPDLDFVFATDFDGKSTIAAKAANIATKKGMLFIASAGNEGLSSWHMILTPGDADSALTIGSVDNTGTPWGTSGYGPNAAGQVKPDVCGLGHVASVFNATGGYVQLDGTSLSTPQIAGWAACLWQANPSATPWQLRQAIIKCASSYSSPGTHIGYGIPDFHCTEHFLNVPDTPPPFTSANWIIPMPNPFTSELKLALSPESDNEFDFRIVDVTGKTVVSFSHFFYKGYNLPYTISLQALPTGIYILRANSPTQHKTIKLEKH